ncbi:MAG: hypothetical protein RL154_1484 [Pseudomonadota bacterium]|jgi:murein DD-endopeptidase MepM/ murein hydrolase activator NlpD
MRRGQVYAYVWFFATISLIFGAIALFVIFSSTFERNPPTVNAPSIIIWNMKTPIKFILSDDSGIKEYKISIVDQNKQTTLFDENLSDAKKNIEVTLAYPKDAFIPSSNAYVDIQMKDKSMWGWFGGNKTSLKIPLLVDSTPPQVRILSNSQAIYRGGSALIAFSAIDNSKIATTWLETSDGATFATQPMDTNNTFVSIVAWDIKSPKFSVFACAKDFAGNISKIPVSILTKDIPYKTSKIKLSADLVDQKMAHLCENTPNGKITDAVECFKYVNNTLRAKNEALIYKITQRMGTSAINGFFTEPFLPITKAQVVGTFGDHRIFELNNEVISESYHMGIDFASTKEAVVVAPNNGVVLFAGDNGIYGNMLVIYHGLGLSTLYGHCSNIAVKEGDLVKRGQIIAHTGSTGLAFGDHLHYGVVVQGVPVRPVEWLDARWINHNVTLMFNMARGK